MLHQLGVLFKDFAHWAERTTKRLRRECEQQAQARGIPATYLCRSGVDKEALARQIAQEQGVASDGSSCMLSVVEMCKAPTVTGNSEAKQLEIRVLPRTCIFLYSYFDDPDVGFGHVRLQTWAPYAVTICLNGRHWLEKQLQAHHVGYFKAGNCFPRLDDIALA